MLSDLRSYASPSKSFLRQIKSWEYQSRPLGAEDVEIKISHCGICGSDLHTLDSGWGQTTYPCVVGHEIVGEVTQAGPDIKGLQVGDRFAIKIPDNIPSDVAAPLMCAGTTVFTPFKEAGIKEGDRVDIVGIGGLCHIAIQFAKAMGAASVTAFSRSN
ncbi:hypothetical protein PInf_012505 [Phytophthora infestans]|nr:hypothetical protein PInf_012502 [Phytophthora infestans]KAI9995440.1 hypothetical protein PInf_012505 [Phytophthora infestans]